MKTFFLLCSCAIAWSLVAAETVYYYGFRGEPIVLTRLDDGSTPWPVVSYGAGPLVLTGRVGLKRAGEERVTYRTLAPGEDPFAVAQRLAADPTVQWAQPEWFVRVTVLAVPNDPYFSSEWHLPQAQVPTAWETTVGFHHTVLAFVDSGVDFSHPDLTGNLLPGEDFTGGDGAMCDHPESGALNHLIAAHGTAVAGIIGALKDNGIGIAGVCPACSLFPVKLVRYDELVIPASRIYDAIVAAVDAGADVINNSWGEEDTDLAGNCVAVPLDSFRAEAVRYAKTKGRNGRGTILVWASGNSQCDTALNENLKLPDIIVVAALDSGGNLAWYSNRGAAITFSAGAANWTTDITGPAGINKQRSATPDDTLDYTNQFSGTSAAAAVVSGVAGLLYAANPLLSFAEAQRCLRLAAVRPPTTTCAAGEWETPDDDPYAPAGAERSPCYGYGIPDAATLVRIARDGTCGPSYAGCATDAECGGGFRCDRESHECVKKSPSPSSGSGCALVLFE